MDDLINEKGVMETAAALIDAQAEIERLRTELKGGSDAWHELSDENERLRAALNDVATMSFSTKPAGMSELEWSVCNLRTLQLYAGEALIANEQKTPKLLCTDYPSCPCGDADYDHCEWKPVE